jgi:hypothetical protein
MLSAKATIQSLVHLMQAQWSDLPAYPATVVEERVHELETMGLVDDAAFDAVPGTVRQYAIASLRCSAPLPFFIATDEALLERREALEARFGVRIVTVPEAMLLLHEINGPPN